MLNYLKNLFTGISVNFIYDILKVIFWVILWFTWCKYLNKSKIKWNYNEVKQKSWKNKSEIDWNWNKVEQI